MSDEKKPSFRATMMGRWQIPALLAGVCLLGTGLYRIVAAYEPVTFEQQLDKVRLLRERGALTRANAYVGHLLSQKELPEDHSGELHRLLVGIVYKAETGLRRHKPENARAIVTQFHKAVACGTTPDAEDFNALGHAYLWLDRRGDAISALRRALSLGPRRPIPIRRLLVALETQPGRPLSPSTLADLDAIVADADAAPGDYRWALEQKIKSKLDGGQSVEALALVEQGKQRLAGTAERLALVYSEALCLWKTGRPLEAETLLRSFRNSWTAHDDLWGRSGWLLGRLQQDDGRPQAALAFFEDVLGSFQVGVLNDVSELGRAECLVELDRYERALTVFERLKPRLIDAEPGAALNRDAVRTTMTTVGESLIRSDRPRLGIRFLETALSLADASDGVLRSEYASRIAAGLVDLAHAARQATPAPGADGEAASLFARAAEMYLSKAGLMPLDEEATATALESAADSFDAAGLTDRAVEVLTQLTAEHPTFSRRAEALLRLALAHRALRSHAAAVASFETLVADHARSPSALAAVVPLAESLISLGDDQALRGERMLVDVVDERGENLVFGPQAKEYRRALFTLAEYLCASSEAAEASVDQAPSVRLAGAIGRLEDAISLYPDDPRIPRLRFLLAEAYRQSAQLIREADADRFDEAAAKESLRRFRAALEGYEAVKAALASVDTSSLDDLEKTYLRTSYLYIGDCLFDLGRLDAAVEAYREAAWRYENEPAAVSAAMQVVHCYQRLGKPAEATAALARLEWLLKKIPEAAFDTQRRMSSKAYWQTMARRMARVQL